MDELEKLKAITVNLESQDATQIAEQYIRLMYVETGLGYLMGTVVLALIVYGIRWFIKDITDARER